MDKEDGNGNAVTGTQRRDTKSKSTVQEVEEVILGILRTCGWRTDRRGGDDLPWKSNRQRLATSLLTILAILLQIMGIGNGSSSSTVQGPN